MDRKEMRNGESVSCEATYSGICKFYGKPAEVTSFFNGTVECKTDLQKTYRFKRHKCSLQKENGFPNPACIDECPLIRKEHL